MEGSSHGLNLETSITALHFQQIMLRHFKKFWEGEISCFPLIQYGPRRKKRGEGA
jgi:hypothetical protein